MIKQLTAVILPLLFLSAKAEEPIIVKALCINFPPYYYVEGGKCIGGHVVDRLNEWNKKQHKYKFEMFPSSPARRVSDLKAHKYDLSLYDNLNWGWEKNDPDIETSCTHDSGAEGYVTTVDKAKGRQSYFDNLKDKILVAMNGYFYGFANFNADREYLEKNFHIILTNSYNGNIMHVIKGHADIAVTTLAYLDDWKKQHPEYADKLFVADKKDQIYQFSAVVRKGSPISIKELNVLLKCNKK